MESSNVNETATLLRVYPSSQNWRQKLTDNKDKAKASIDSFFPTETSTPEESLTRIPAKIPLPRNTKSEIFRSLKAIKASPVPGEDLTLTHSPHLLPPLDIGCFTVLERLYGRRLEMKASYWINHTDKLDFLEVYPRARIKISKPDLIEKSLEAAGVVVVNTNLAATLLVSNRIWGSSR